MQSIKVAAPAKINLTLEVLDKRPDGFHNIKSIMQAISIYDYLTFDILGYSEAEQSGKNEIALSGTSNEIPYNEKNLVYKAIAAYCEKAKISGIRIKVFIEKNIPVEAGLAGGSTDAAAAFYALNKIFKKLKEEEIEELCASLGSDLNFCLHGGTALCSGRGENIRKIKTEKSPVTLIKPVGFGISAKEAYTKFAMMTDKSAPNNTEKMCNRFDKNFLYNSLEKAVINDYKELLLIKKAIPESMMSGSGPTFFILEKNCPYRFNNKEFQVIENLEFIDHGIRIIN